jgi:hypothetical protein
MQNPEFYPRNNFPLSHWLLFVGCLCFLLYRVLYQSLD